MTTSKNNNGPPKRGAAVEPKRPTQDRPKSGKGDDHHQRRHPEEMTIATI